MSAAGPLDTGADEVIFGLADEVIEALDGLDRPHDGGIELDEALAEAQAVHEERADTSAFVIGGNEIELTVPCEFTIGRIGDHRVDHPAVSRLHLVVCSGPLGTFCHDLESGNGSWLVRGTARSQLGVEGEELVPSDRVVTIDDIELLQIPGAT